MSQPFEKTIRSIRADRGVHVWVLAGVAVIFAVVWTVWFVVGEVPVYVTTPEARLEVDRSVHVVEAPVAGRVLETQLALGKEVDEGDVLVRLDPESAELERRKLEATLSTLPDELDALREAIEAERQALERSGATSRAGAAEARARRRRADIAATQARAEYESLKKLVDQGVAPRGDLEKARSRMREEEATAESLRSAVDRVRGEQTSGEADRTAAIAHLRREKAKIEGRIATLKATVETLTHQIEQHTIRAPVAGRIGDFDELKPGSFVNQGQNVASVIPEGDIRVVASFDAEDALGRIEEGMNAQMRLDGFPWTQYGMVRATVARVGSEPSSGSIRVDLDVDRDRSPERLLQHGLPGSLEVEIERVAPAVLVLRAAGQTLGGEDDVRTPARSSAEGSP